MLDLSNLLVKFKTTLEKASNEYANIKRDFWRYAVVGLATLVALGVVYKDFELRVYKEELEAKSLLHLAPRNVQFKVPSVGLGQVLSNRKIAIPNQNKSHDKPQAYIPPEATVVITPKDPTKTIGQVVNVKVENTWGLTFEPGLDISIAPLSLGLDAKLFYIERLGTEAGFSKELVLQKKWTPTVGLSYRLDKFKYSKNTELEISYAPLGSVPVYVGVRINF